MERRWSPRVPLETAVTVYRQGAPLLMTHTCDISLEGVSLKDGHQALPDEALLELDIMLAANSVPERFRIPGYVVHRDHCLGLTYTAFNPRLFHAVEKLTQQQR